MASNPKNGTLSANGYSTLPVRITAVTFGTTIASSSSASRNSRTLYTTAQSSYSFGIAIVCPSNAEYVVLGDWLIEYGRRIQTNSVGLVRVRLPSRGFDRIGVPNGAGRGATAGESPRSMTLGFIGASDLVSLATTDVNRLSNTLASEVKAITGKDKKVAYFYPTGTQLTGQAKGEDLLYDSTTSSDYTPSPTAMSPGELRLKGGT